MSEIRIYADLHKYEQLEGELLCRVILTCRGTSESLAKLGITFEEGKLYHFWMDDADEEGNFDPLYFEGIVNFDHSKNYWVALVDWNSSINRSKE